MSLSRELRDALERLRGNLSTLAQEYPEAGAFLAALRREAAPLLAQVENDDQRHALLAERASWRARRACPARRRAGC